MSCVPFTAPDAAVGVEHQDTAGPFGAQGQVVLEAFTGVLSFLRLMVAPVSAVRPGAGYSLSRAFGRLLLSFQLRQALLHASQFRLGSLCPSGHEPPLGIVEP